MASAAAARHDEGGYASTRLASLRPSLVEEALGGPSYTNGALACAKLRSVILQLSTGDLAKKSEPNSSQRARAHALWLLESLPDAAELYAHDRAVC